MSNKFKPNGRKFRDAKREVMAEFVRAYFAELAKETGGNISEMARRAGMGRAHMRAVIRSAARATVADLP
jgi:DNA-binding NtrC family response regulator